MCLTIFVELFQVLQISCHFTSVVPAARGEVKPHLDIIWLMSCLSDLTAEAISTENVNTES